ncbi:hypothetical protein FA13DRAFT_1815212 [Coprinellus micaceus]|uniref:Nephrocystin 3-like N-terminal domain-containing protein n=1 Tax=Coprinellus micaceus TaxID=71717 RepID=A0A4Y7T5Z3_COPMI|nr:hypothetical protein FA13DRAFT_1815212 [Coprinellus micaceus]
MAQSPLPRLEVPVAQSNEGTSFFAGSSNFQIGNQVNNINNITIVNHDQKSAFDTLNEKLNPLTQATHNRNLQISPPDSQCLPGTREKIIQQIKAWADSGILLKGVPSHVLWLYGYVGCGKSAIAQTIADKFDKKRRLAASFFFFRGMGDRSRGARFSATIASQLAKNIPATIPLIDIARVSWGNDLDNASVATQFEQLFLQPFHAALRSPGRLAQSILSGPYLTVIDGLDECEDQEDVAKLIEKIIGFFKDKPRSPLRFFISSRVEQHIGSRLRVEGSNVEEMDLAAETSEEDITFVVDETFRIASRNDRVIEAYGDWPTQEERRQLVKNADRSFIIISTLLKFILHTTGDGRTPLDRLPLALDFKNGLDDLYAEILSRSKDIIHFYDVVSTIALVKEPLSPIELGRLLRVKDWDVMKVLVDLCAIIHLPAKNELPVTLFHSSLREFLCTESRSAPHFFASPSHHKLIALRCFERMLGPIKENLASYAKRYFHHHWESNVAFRSDDPRCLREDLRECIAHFQGEFSPFPPSVVHISILTFALLDPYWVTTISPRHRKLTVGQLATRFAGKTRSRPEITVLGDVLNGLEHLLSALSKLESTSPPEELLSALHELESTSEATTIPSRPSLLSQHTLLVENCLSHLFTFDKDSRMPISFLPDSNRPPSSRVPLSMKQPGDLDVSDYSFWALSLHLANAIKHDPGLARARLASHRKYSTSTGVKEPVPPFEYLVAQHRYYDAEQTGGHLQRFKASFELATSALERVLETESLGSLPSSSRWGFHNVVGESNYWAYGCFENDTSILNMWMGFGNLAQCFIALQEGTHSRETCTLHQLYDTARREGGSI